MFGFLDKLEAEALGSAGRFPKRIEKFVAKNKRFPKIQHFFWWFVHNCLAHLFLGICPCKYTFEFHDWTSIKLNAENPADHKKDDLLDEDNKKTFTQRAEENESNCIAGAGQIMYDLAMANILAEPYRSFATGSPVTEEFKKNWKNAISSISEDILMFHKEINDDGHILGDVTIQIEKKKK